MTTRKHLLVAVVLTGIGLAGLLVGEHFHPDSNLLGGWALVFGPIYWLGLAAIFLSSLRLVSSWFTGRRMDDDAESDNAQ